MENESKTIKTESFTSEVLKYFMSFLETDFKKRRLPKRNTINKYNTSFQVAINIEKYSQLKKWFHKQFHNGFTNSELELKRGVYLSKLPDTVINFINRSVTKIKLEDIGSLYTQLSIDLSKIKKEKKSDINEYLETVEEHSKELICRNIISPLISLINDPIEKATEYDSNLKFQLEYEILEKVFSSFRTRILDYSQEYFILDSTSIDSKQIEEEIIDLINIEEIKAILTSFFNEYAIVDAYFDFYQLFRNSKILENTEIYFYMYEVAYKDYSFPIFYIPIDVSKHEDVIKLTLNNRVFINKKAIDFVVQEYNDEFKIKGSLSSQINRIIYIDQIEDYKKEILNTINSIENYFVFNKDIDINNYKLQSHRNVSVSLSNRAYLYLFDKSDESLLNDYEEILTNNLLHNIFDKLIHGFVVDNPVSVNSDIEDSWINSSYSERLAINSPVPLNEEQKQVLSALDDPRCKSIVIEGPPGTGKSHTITAIICKNILEGKSVLVLSDKAEALDVVEDKITSTLNKVRNEENFQNPILRLGKSGDKFKKILENSIIEKIKEHNLSYRQHESRFNEDLHSYNEKVKENVEIQTKHFSEVDLNKIKYFYSNITFYKDNIEVVKIKNEDECIKVISFLKDLIEFKDVDVSLASLNNERYNSIKNVSGFLSEFFLLQKDKKFNNQFLVNNYNSCNDGVLADINDLFLFSKELVENKIIPARGDIKYYVSEINELIKIIEVILKSKQYMNIYDQSFYEIINQFTEINTDNYEEKLKNTNNFSKLSSHNPFLSLVKYIFNKKRIVKEYESIRKDFFAISFKPNNKNIKKLLLFNKLIEFVVNNLPQDIDRNVFLKKLVQLISMDINIEELHAISKRFISSYDKIKWGDKEIDPEIINIYLETGKTIRKLWEVDELFSQLKKDGSDINFVLNDFTTEEQSNTRKFERIKEFYEYRKKDENKYKEAINLIINDKDAFEAMGITIDTPICNINYFKKQYSQDEIQQLFKLKGIESELEYKFKQSPEDLYFEYLNKIENLVTVKMASIIDSRVIEYTQNNANEVQTLKGIIKKKQKFPKELFVNLKKSFPCILAGIRDYADYIPLDMDLFDIIIIDESSQVSISQALPALIRGKQIVVLGDDKQFSNVKSNNASKIMNQLFKNKVLDTFNAENLIKDDQYGYISKIKDNFDIKNSILKFMKFIRNYSVVLRKHFRCYPEIISYSNKYFYNNYLQCIKLRAKPIKEVIKFDYVENDGEFELFKNTNELEAKLIIKHMQSVVEDKLPISIGIISPHREQVSLLTDMVNQLDIRDELYDLYKLKIMTFDTCQGEERDYIYYSMVASKENDKLKWIFLKDFKQINDEIDGHIKAQRLNVGFSRAKETIHFVLSKEISEFEGEIKNALQHYYNELVNQKDHSDYETDPNSPMEDIVLRSILQTPFYQEFKDNIELIPQFPIGEYLKQLDRTYKHPKYKVDFLLLVNDNKIIIEYDGFKEHFNNLENVNEDNFEYYLKEDDIYRQKIIEGYGYEFIRINKFNLGEDPVTSLNQILFKRVKKKRNDDEQLFSYKLDIDILRYKLKKVCPECNVLLPFFDFPYKASPLCFSCWEKKNDKVFTNVDEVKVSLIEEFNFINETNIPDNGVFDLTSEDIETNASDYINKIKTASDFLIAKCPRCFSFYVGRKGKRGDRIKLECNDCGKSWTADEDKRINQLKKIRIKAHYQGTNTGARDNLKKVRKVKEQIKIEPEIPYKEIVKRVNLGNTPLKFYYKDDATPRSVYTYYTDETYLFVKTRKGYYIQYRLDRIRNVV